MNIQTEASDQAILQELGRRLARHRLNQNLTQEELARESGIGVNTIYRIEQGHSTQLSNLIRLLRVLGIVTNFDQLIANPPPSPMGQAKLQKEQRQRASSKKPEVPLPNIWKWDEE